MTRIINISGKAHHGKTTLANLIKDKLELAGYSVQVLNFADAVKEEAYDRGWDGSKDREGRELRQNIGHGRRNEDYDYWIKKAEEKIEEDTDFAILADTRYENEITYFGFDPQNKEYEGQCVIRIERWEDYHKQIMYDNGYPPELKAHPSETALDDRWDLFDIVVDCENDIDEVEKSANVLVDEMIKEIEGDD